MQNQNFQLGLFRDIGSLVRASRCVFKEVTPQIQLGADAEERFKSLETRSKIKTGEVNEMRTKVQERVNKNLEHLNKILNAIGEGKPTDPQLKKIANLSYTNAFTPEINSVYRTDMTARIDATLKEKNISAPYASKIMLEVMSAVPLADGTSAAKVLTMSMHAVQEGTSLRDDTKKLFIGGKNKAELAKKMEGGEKATLENFKVTIDGQEYDITRCEILTGASMTDISPQFTDGFKLKNAILIDDGQRVIAQMENGCKGNLVIIDVTPPPSSKVIVPPAAPLVEATPPGASGEAPPVITVVPAPCEVVAPDEIGMVTSALEAVRAEREDLSIAVHSELGLKIGEQPIKWLNFTSKKNRVEFETALQKAHEEGLKKFDPGTVSEGMFPEEYNLTATEIQPIVTDFVNVGKIRTGDETKAIDFHFDGDVENMKFQTNLLIAQLEARKEDDEGMSADLQARIKTLEDLKTIIEKNADIIRTIPRDRLASIENPVVRGIATFFEGLGRLVTFDGEGLRQMSHELGRDMIRSKEQRFLNASGELETFSDMKIEEPKANAEGTALDNVHYSIKQNEISDERLRKIFPEEADLTTLRAELAKVGPLIAAERNVVMLTAPTSNPDNSAVEKMRTLMQKNRLTAFRLDLGNGLLDFVFDRYLHALPNETEFAEFQKDNQLPATIGTLPLTYEIYKGIVEGDLNAEQQKQVSDALSACGLNGVKVPIDRSKLVFGVIVFAAALASFSIGGGGVCEARTAITPEGGSGGVTLVI